MNDSSEQNKNILHMKYQVVNRMHLYVVIFQYIKQVYLYSDKTMCIKL